MNTASLITGLISGAATNGPPAGANLNALITAGAALGGATIGILGNAYLERLRERRAARRERGRAIADMLTAAADLMSGIQAARATYDRSAWRRHLRTIATVYTAISAAFAGEDKLTLNAFLDWHKSAPFLERLLAADHGLTDQQRALAVGLAGMLLPRTSRFYAAITVLTLGEDKKAAAAARDLAGAVAQLLEAVGAKDRKYTRARHQAEQAHSKFRDFANQRPH